MDPEYRLICRNGKDAADAASGGAGPSRQLVPHGLGPDTPSSGEQSRTAAGPRVRARRGELRVLVSIDLVVGRPGVTRRGAEGDAVERAGGKRGVEPAHPLRRPVISG